MNHRSGFVNILGYPNVGKSSIINALAHVQDLHVVARTSSFQFPSKGYDIHEIGEKLKVNNVLEGSVRKAGNKLRITAQLINVEDGYHLWSEKYDRELKDVFNIYKFL